MGEVGEKGDSTPRVLVAIEPLSYGDALGNVIRILRPELRVEIVDTPTLYAGINHLEADLVLASRPRPEATRLSLLWVEFCPYSAPTAFYINGRRSDTERVVGLDDLLAVVDELVRRRLTAAAKSPQEDRMKSSLRPVRGEPADHEGDALPAP